MEKENKWISVKDKLPELTMESKYGFGLQSIPVLCIDSKGRHDECFLENEFEDPDKTWFCLTDGSFETINNVTHWMPLPEPPESE